MKHVQRNNNAIPQDYTRVEVHTVKPEFMKWKIEHPTPEGLDLLWDVMNQFILWHKKDIVLIACSPTPSDVHLERVVEDGEVYSLARDDHTSKMPHSSPNPSHNMPQPSLALTEQRRMTRHRMCLTRHNLLQLIPSKGMTRRRMCLTSHNLLQLMPSKDMMRCHSLLNKRSRHMNNECLLKKDMHEKMRTCLNGKFKTRFPSR
jgi:hypothetical protein